MNIPQIYNSNGHLVCFQFSVVMNNSAMNIFIHSPGIDVQKFKM